MLAYERRVCNLNKAFFTLINCRCVCVPSSYAGTIYQCRDLLHILNPGCPKFSKWKMSYSAETRSALHQILRTDSLSTYRYMYLYLSIYMYII